MQSAAQRQYQAATTHAAMVKEAYGENSKEYDHAGALQVEAEDALFEWGEEVFRARPEWEQIEPIFYAVEPEQVKKVIRLLMSLDANQLAA